MRNSPTVDQNTLYRIRDIHGQMSSPTSQIIVHHIMRATRVCRPPHPNGILSSTIQTGWALFSINTALPAIHTHLISQFACKQSTFHSVKVHNRTIKSRSGDGSRHFGMWWTIVLHISWSTVPATCPYGGVRVCTSVARRRCVEGTTHVRRTHGHNSLRPTQDVRRSVDDIFKRILFNENVTTQLQILLDLSLSVQLTINQHWFR